MARSKYEPRTIKLGAVRVGYDTFEPFNLNYVYNR